MAIKGRNFVLIFFIEDLIAWKNKVALRVKDLNKQGSASINLEKEPKILVIIILDERQKSNFGRLLGRTFWDNWNLSSTVWK